MPSQNTGSDTPINATTVISRSDHRPAVTAAMTPTTIPQKSQISPAPIESENVAGRPLSISLATSVWFANERSTPYGSWWPGRRPFTAFSIIRTYWT